MRALEFIIGHMIYNPAYTYKFQLKTTQGEIEVCYPCTTDLIIIFTAIQIGNLPTNPQITFAKRHLLSLWLLFGSLNGFGLESWFSSFTGNTQIQEKVGVSSMIQTMSQSL